MHSGVFQFDRFNRLENTHLYDKIRRATSITTTHRLWFIHDPRSTITTTSQQCFPHKNSKICGVRHTHIHARFSVILIFISRSNQTDQTSFHLYSEYVSKYAISVNAMCLCVVCERFLFVLFVATFVLLVPLLPICLSLSWLLSLPESVKVFATRKSAVRQRLIVQ